MTVENSVRILAGLLVMISLVMYYYVSPYWLLLTAFVGLNLFQSAITNFCLAEIILKKLFYSSGK